MIDYCIAHLISLATGGSVKRFEQKMSIKSDGRALGILSSMEEMDFCFYISVVLWIGWKGNFHRRFVRRQQPCHRGYSKDNGCATFLIRFWRKFPARLSSDHANDEIRGEEILTNCVTAESSTLVLQANLARTDFYKCYSVNVWAEFDCYRYANVYPNCPMLNL